MYTSGFVKRHSIRGGGVGACYRESVDVKRTADIETLQPDLKGLCLRLPGKNRYSKIPFAVIYDNRSTCLPTPRECLDRLELLLRYINF